ncbi:MAG: hypothetical protein AAGD25_10225 [Cyanobacteria bacterium P01_F01_bin.150]
MIKTIKTVLTSTTIFIFLLSSCTKEEIPTKISIPNQDIILKKIQDLESNNYPKIAYISSDYIDFKKSSTWQPIIEKYNCARSLEEATSILNKAFESKREERGFFEFYINEGNSNDYRLRVIKCDFLSELKYIREYVKNDVGSRSKKKNSASDLPKIGKLMVSEIHESTIHDLILTSPFISRNSIVSEEIQETETHFHHAAYTLAAIRSDKKNCTGYRVSYLTHEVSKSTGLISIHRRGNIKDIGDC